MVEALREGRNNVEVIGTVKKVEIQEKDSKTGRPMIIGSVTLEVKEKNIKAINIYTKNGFISNPQPASPLLAMSLRNNHE